MHKISVPICMNTVNERTLPLYAQQFKACRAERVFLCGLGHIYTKDTLLKTDPDNIARAISYFQEQGLEVGLWISAFGHGEALPFQAKAFCNYTPIEGINGGHAPHAICPSDPRFLHDYREAIKQLASLKPDIIMLDDDFRINVRARNYHFGCFCERHLAEFFKRIGEEIPREQLEKLILCGGENKYRTAYLDMMGESLLHFARELRAALDEVDPTIRLGTCATHESWDLCGTDVIDIAKAFAGNTKPFARVSGAPYWNDDIIPIVEYVRQQYAWGKDRGVELFSEGDTYPRPRYNIPSKPLELFDMALLADGTSGGMLHYVFDYLHEPEYEDGYVKRFVRNQPLRNQIQELFADKHPIGVRVCASQKKFKHWELPKQLPDNLFTDLQRAASSPAQYLIAPNSIPTAYQKNDYPALVLGTNARDITVQDLQHGAILDVEAANILQRKGIDVGLIKEEKQKYNTEYFVGAEDSISGFSNIATRKIECHESATVLSRFLPDNTPASYLYENKDGMRFFVIAFDYYASHENTLSIVKIKNPCRNYFNNYYRQADLIRAIEWIGGCKLPAVCTKNPNLYLLTCADESGTMSVALCNVHLDDIIEPTVKLDRAYSSIRFVNCTGKLQGDTVTLSDIPPYGFVAFEVKN